MNEETGTVFICIGPYCWGKAPTIEEAWKQCRKEWPRWPGFTKPDKTKVVFYKAPSTFYVNEMGGLSGPSKDKDLVVKVDEKGNPLLKEDAMKGPSLTRTDCPQCGADFPIAEDELSGTCPDCGAKVMRIVKENTRPKLSLGQTVVTAGVAEWMNREGNAAFVQECFDRHSQGDWGETEDKAINDAALETQDRVISVYRKGDTVLWIITDAGWEVTTALFPSEY